MPLDRQGVELMISVPFERFVELKKMIERRQRWHRVDEETRSFEAAWKPQGWVRRSGGHSRGKFRRAKWLAHCVTMNESTLLRPGPL